MTRTELHELLDIVMDAMEKGNRSGLSIGEHYTVAIFSDKIFNSFDYNDFSDFTQAVKEYIHGLI